MIKAMVVAALITAGAAMGAPTLAHADADSAGFIDYLSRHGEDVTTPEVRYAAIDYGYTIFNLYRVSRSNDVVLQTTTKGTQNVAVYSVGCVMYLCPELEYLLP